MQKNASKTEKAARTKKVRAAALGSTCYNTGCNGAFALVTNINRMALLNTKRIRQPNGQARGIPSAPHSV